MRTVVVVLLLITVVLCISFVHSVQDYPLVETVATAAAVNAGLTQFRSCANGQHRSMHTSGQIILTSLDGHVYSVDLHTGRLNWALDSGGLLISSKMHNGETNVMPGNDGALYSVDSQKIRRSTMTIKDLVIASPYNSGNDDNTYVGRKDSRMFMISRDSGTVLRLFDTRNGPDDSTCDTLDDYDQRNVLFVTRTDFILQAYDKKSGVQQWNVSFGELSSTIDGEYVFEEPTSLYGDKWLPLIASTSMGGVRAYHPCFGTQLWDFSMQAPLAQAIAQFENGASVKLVHLYMRTLPFKLGSASEPQSSIVSIEPENDLILGKFSGKLQQYFVLTNSPATTSQPVLLPIDTFRVPNDLQRIGDGSEKNVESKKTIVINPTPPGKPSGETSIVVVLQFQTAVTYVVGLIGVLIFVFVSGKLFGKSNSNSTMETIVPKEVFDDKVSSPVDEEETKKDEDFVSSNAIVRIGKVVVDTSSLLGTGSQGTVVYEGTFEGRKVAVKRLLKQFYENAAKEVSLLMDSDHHPNVVRYFAQESDGHFVYVALEKCDYTLNSAVCGNKSPFKLLDSSRRPTAETMRMLTEVFNGVSHLHTLGIVHRDIKPHNILLTREGKVKIADMGLGKKLEGNRNSFDTSSFGSAGWHAPETLLIRQSLDDEKMNGSRGRLPRLTRSVDNFSLGCLVHYVLTQGRHPYGESFERDGNILRGRYCLDEIAHLPEAYDLVINMIDKDPERRLTCEEALNHPFFWNEEQKLEFICHTSDRVENEDADSVMRKTLEKFAPEVVGSAWDQKLYAGLLANLGKYRKYNFESIRDCLRVIRNKKNHYRDLPDDVKEVLGEVPVDFFHYFAERFPGLVIFCFEFIGAFCPDEAYFCKVYSAVSFSTRKRMRSKIRHQ